MLDDVDDDTNQSRENIANHSRYPNLIKHTSLHLVYKLGILSHSVRQQFFLLRTILDGSTEK